jgi:hypothetical protein
MARFLLAQSLEEPAVNPNRKGRKDDLTGVLRSSAGCRSPSTCAGFTNGAVLHHLQRLHEFWGNIEKRYVLLLHRPRYLKSEAAFSVVVRYTQRGPVAVFRWSAPTLQA